MNSVSNMVRKYDACSLRCFRIILVRKHVWTFVPSILRSCSSFYLILGQIIRKEHGGKLMRIGNVFVKDQDYLRLTF